MCGVLQSTEKFPDANLEERDCSESSPREVICYPKLHGLEKDSRQKKRQRRKEYLERRSHLSSERMNSGSVNNLGRGKGSPKRSRKKEFQKTEINGEQEHNGGGF